MTPWCPQCGANDLAYNAAQMIFICDTCGIKVTAEYMDAYLGGKTQKPKAKVAKFYDRPCLKCKAIRAFKYDLKKDWYQCIICLYCYSSETMTQVKDNFTYPGTAKFLKSFFPFFVASSYPQECALQLAYQQYEGKSLKWQNKQFNGLVIDGTDNDFEILSQASKPVDTYRERAASEFEGVEELDPSLWTADGDAGLL